MTLLIETEVLQQAGEEAGSKDTNRRPGRNDWRGGGGSDGRGGKGEASMGRCVVKCRRGTGKAHEGEYLKK